MQHVYNRRGAKAETSGDVVEGKKKKQWSRRPCSAGWPTKGTNQAPDLNCDQISSRALIKVVLEFLSKRPKLCHLQAYSSDHIL